MDKFWLDAYPKNVKKTIDTLPYSSLPDLFDSVVKNKSTELAFTNFDCSLTYQELNKQVHMFASYLTGVLHLEKGDRFAIMLPNLMQYPIAMFAALKAGLVIVNINPLYTSRELLLQLKDSGAVAILIWEYATYHLQSIYDKTSIKHCIITKTGDCLSAPKSWLVNMVSSYKAQFPACDIKNAITFKKAMHLGAESFFIQPVVGLNDIAYLQYTGGTTGVPKAAILTHKNMLYNIEQAYTWLSGLLTAKQEVVITPLPLYHIFSLMANCWLFLKLGGHNILITNPRDIPGLLKTLRKYKYTVMTGVNTLFNALLENDNFAKLSFDSVKIFFGGGMSVQKSVAEKWQAVTKIPLLEGYGLTESSPAAIINSVYNKHYNGAIGLPLPSTEIKIIDKDGKELSINTPGELCIRGPQVMRGYWQNQAETLNVLDKDGWLKTGDIAQIDATGLVFIIDRKKDVIIVSGFNVYPNEIEEVYAQHPSILEVAAIGIPDDATGEAVKIFVVSNDTAITPAVLINYGKEHLTSYKVPKLVEFKKELPKSNIGKILRKNLRSEVTE